MKRNTNYNFYFNIFSIYILFTRSAVDRDKFVRDNSKRRTEEGENFMGELRMFTSSTFWFSVYRTLLIHTRLCSCYRKS